MSTGKRHWPLSFEIRWPDFDMCLCTLYGRVGGYLRNPLTSLYVFSCVCAWLKWCFIYLTSADVHRIIGITRTPIEFTLTFASPPWASLFYVPLRIRLESTCTTSHHVTSRSHHITSHHIVAMCILAHSCSLRICILLVLQSNSHWHLHRLHGHRCSMYLFAFASNLHAPHHITSHRIRTRIRTRIRYLCPFRIVVVIASVIASVIAFVIAFHLHSHPPSHSYSHSYSHSPFVPIQDRGRNRFRNRLRNRIRNRISLAFAVIIVVPSACARHPWPPYPHLHPQRRLSRCAGIKLGSTVS